MASLENSAVILRLINQLRRAVTVTDLTEHLGMPKSSASRLLKQMAEQGFLERDEVTRAYAPGLMVLELAHLVRSTTPLFGLLQKALSALCQKTGHTGYLSVLDGSDVMALYVQPGTQPLRLTTYPGHRSPAWATSTGRALLALEPNEALDARLPSPLPFVAANVPGDLAQLHARIDAERRQGYAVALDEAISGVGSISCAVWDRATNERFALCLSFPAAGLDTDAVQALAADLMAEARSIGRLVGMPS